MPPGKADPKSSQFDIAHSIVRLKVHGKVSKEAMAVFMAPALRALAQQTMNIEALLVDYTPFRTQPKNPPS